MKPFFLFLIVLAVSLWIRSGIHGNGGMKRVRFKISQPPTTLLVVIFVVACEFAALFVFAAHPLVLLEIHYRWIVGLHLIGVLAGAIPWTEEHIHMGYTPTWIIISAMTVIAIGTTWAMITAFSS